MLALTSACTSYCHKPPSKHMANFTQHSLLIEHKRERYYYWFCFHITWHFKRDYRLLHFSLLSFISETSV